MKYNKILNVSCYFTQNRDTLYLGAFKENITYANRSYYKPSNTLWELNIITNNNDENLNHFLIHGNFDLYYSMIVEGDGNKKVLWYKMDNAKVTNFNEETNEDETFSYSFCAEDCLLISENMLPNEIKSRL